MTRSARFLFPLICIVGCGTNTVADGGDAGTAAADDGGAFAEAGSNADSGGADADPIADAGAGDALTDASADASADADAGSLCSYAAPETCMLAELLTAVPGDVGAGVVTKTGKTSRFFKVKIEEQDKNIAEEHDLSYVVTLQSPPGMNYDLLVRQGLPGGAPNCVVTPKAGTGTPETVTDSWDDNQGASDDDDGLWLTIEVVYVSGNLCGSSDLWTLTVKRTN